jgi:hypothetical protein
LVKKKNPTGLYKNVSQGILKPCALQCSLRVIQHQTVGNLTLIPVTYTFGYQTFKPTHNNPLSTALGKGCTSLLQYQEKSRITI